MWYLSPVREEIDFVLERVKHIQNHETQRVIQIILSRTIVLAGQRLMQI